MLDALVAAAEGVKDEDISIPFYWMRLILADKQPRKHACIPISIPFCWMLKQFDPNECTIDIYISIPFCWMLGCVTVKMPHKLVELIDIYFNSILLDATDKS